ncbi:MAG: transposase [Bacteriovorax sp.]|jgi:putative transposase|nr:transposase [Bacteriovorax sp.]
MAHRCYKFRIFPNKEQEIVLKKTIGCCRYVYNWGLRLRSDAYKKDKTKIGFFETSEQLTVLKSELKWLKEVPAVPLQQSLKFLDAAFVNLFKKQALYPKFKLKKSDGSARFVGVSFRLKDNYFYLSRINSPIKVAWSRKLLTKPSSCNISKSPSGQWFVNFVCEEEVKKLSPSNERIGIDLGIETFATLSDGRKFKQPDSIRKMRRKLARAQRSHSRKKLGSENREKTRIKVARVHQKIVNIRQDFLHKLSTSIVRENQVIAIEDLKVSDIIQKRSRKMSRLIGEQGWQSFRKMLDYKTSWYGRELIVIDQFSPSSQICNSCGKTNKVSLDKRSVKCECGVTYDRDINAAKNILAVGTTVTACGAGIRHLRVPPVAKQESLLEMAR